jgi:Uma2 family endonuclease
MTEADYRALAEDISRSVEIVHGHIIKRESPAPAHDRIARRLSFALEPARSPADPCLTIETAVDVILWRVPRFTFRRPDVVVYECRDDPAGKRTAQNTILVAEVASPGTPREDLLDKRAQHADSSPPEHGKVTSRLGQLSIGCDHFGRLPITSDHFSVRFARFIPTELMGS